MWARVGHEHRLPSLLAVPPAAPTAPPSTWTFLSPKACQPPPGAGDPEDRHPEALLTWRCPPPAFLTRLPMCFARPVLSQRCPVLPPMLLDGCRERGGSCCPSVSAWPGLPPTHPEAEELRSRCRQPPACVGARRSPPGRSFSPRPAGCQSPSGMHGQVSVASPLCPPPGTWGQTAGRSFSPGCNRDQKTDECTEAAAVWMCAPLHGAPRSWELAGPAHGKGCRLLLQAPTASCGGPAWGDARILNQPPLPGSSLGSGGGPCAAGNKLGAARALRTLLQAGKLLLVPTVPLPQGREPWLGQATLSSPVTQRPVPPHAAGPHSIASPWQCSGCCPHYVSE